MKKLLLLLALCCVCGTITAQNTKPQAVIFETDMGNDIDDAMALDLLHSHRAQMHVLCATVLTV